MADVEGSVCGLSRIDGRGIDGELIVGKSVDRFGVQRGVLWIGRVVVDDLVIVKHVDPGKIEEVAGPGWGGIELAVELAIVGLGIRREGQGEVGIWISLR